MDAFWKWLMRTNARAVLLASVLALLLVTAWWLWKEHAPMGEYSFQSLGAKGGVRRDPLPVLRFIREQAELGGVRPDSNPFLAPWRRTAVPTTGAEPLRVAIDPVVIHADADPTVTTGTGPIRTGPATTGTGPIRTGPATTGTGPIRSGPATTGTADPPAAPRPTIPQTVSLTYRGLFRRTDGKVVALIEDSESKASSFYDANAEIFGLNLGRIKPEEADVVLPDGSRVTLTRGEPAVFRGGDDAR